MQAVLGAENRVSSRGLGLGMGWRMNKERRVGGGSQAVVANIEAGYVSRIKRRKGYRKKWRIDANLIHGKSTGGHQ